MAPGRPVLRYFGGKWMLAPKIIEALPPHRVYVEPFAGAASVLIRKPRSYSEVYNDLNDDVVNLFRVLRDGDLSKELKRQLHLTPFSRSEFRAASKPAADPVSRARAIVIRSFMGFGSNAAYLGAGATGFRSSSKRSGSTAAHDWSDWPWQVPAFYERLQGVTIENRDATEVIKQQDSQESLFYCDPPYVHRSRSSKHRYPHELSDEDHEKLIATLTAVKGMVVLSGYESSVYAKLGWSRFEFEVMADGARPKTECLWLNKAAMKAQAQGQMAL